MITSSDQETREFAKNLAKNFKSGVMALIGDLGAGKTTFTQGFAEGLGINDKIISPTFVLIRQHQIPNNKSLYHVDLYRLEEIDIKQLGLGDLFKLDDLVLIEWAEKIKDQLPKNTTFVYIDKISENKRNITVVEPNQPTRVVEEYKK